MLRIDLSRSESWVAFAVTGVLSTPPIGLGLGPDMYLLPLRSEAKDDSKAILAAVEESFASFGIADHLPLTVGVVKVLLIPMRDATAYGVKVGLMVADLALSIFNKKVFGARARLIEWHRREGIAVGAVMSGGRWVPIESKNKAGGPLLMQAPEADVWDTLLYQTITETLTPLGTALRKCLEWERESQGTANITHRFAFLWIGLESMLPRNEKDGPGCVKRLSILTGSPSGYYSNKLRNDPEKSKIAATYTNPEGKRWRSAIEEMYRYRCEILHEGGTEFSSESMHPLKVDWFGKLAENLCMRITLLAVSAMAEAVTEIEDFWENFVPDYLYSDRNHWHSAGVFFHNHYINYDWEDGPYPELFH